jgi:hypothetical protein
MANETKTGKQLVALTDDQIKSIVFESAKLSKRGVTTARTCIIASLRALAAMGITELSDPAIRLQAVKLLDKGHGLCCNASQLGQFAGGKSAKLEDELTAA